MKDEAESLRAEKGSIPTATQVSERVIQGHKFALSTMTQLARTAIRSSENFIEEISLIVNAEHPKLAERLKDELPVHRRSSKTPDCRVYRNIITSSTLKQA